MKPLVRYNLREGLEDLSGNGHDAIGTLDYCHDEWVRCLINSVDAPSFFENDQFKIIFKITDLKDLGKPQLICSNFSNAFFMNWAFYYTKEKLHICIFNKFYEIPLPKDSKELTVEFLKKGTDITISLSYPNMAFWVGVLHKLKAEGKQEDTFTLYLDLGHSSYDVVKMFDCQPFKGFIEYLEIYSGES